MCQVRGKTKGTSLCEEKYKELLLKQRYDKINSFFLDSVGGESMSVEAMVHWIMEVCILAKKIFIQFQTMGKELFTQHTTQFSYRGYVDDCAYQEEYARKID
jgi:hypothetical protein